MRKALAVLLVLSAVACPAAETGTVTEVVDGDTLRVRADDGTRTVRLVGIDAPEKGHPSKPREFLSLESAEFLSSLCAGRMVRMERDAEDRDRHGRLLRYVFIDDGPARPSPGGGALLNLELVRAGYARVYGRFPFSRREEFFLAEAEARRDSRGIWEDAGMAELRWLRGEGRAPVEVYPAGGDTFAVSYKGWGKPGVGREEIPAVVETLIRLRAENSDADFGRKAAEAGFRPFPAESSAGSRSALTPPRPGAAPARAPAETGPIPWDEAHLRIGETVTVEGRIVRTHRGRSVLYLNFHPNWKKYVTVVIFGSDWKNFPKSPETLYRDMAVRVRGTVTSHKGRPEIVVRDPASIEVLGKRP